MRVYAFIGDSGQTIVPDNFNYHPQENEVFMTGERPTGDYVAAADGTWVLKTDTLEEQIAEIDAQYEADKEQLLDYYTEALIREDTTLQADIKAELTALDSQYDTDIQALTV